MQDCFYVVTSFAQPGVIAYHRLGKIIIWDAKFLLMGSPDTGLREIAEACGFRSVSYFGKVFREATGFTPQAYRLDAFCVNPSDMRSGRHGMRTDDMGFP